MINNKRMRRYANATAVELDTGKGVENVDALREKVRAARRLTDAKTKEKADAPLFAVGERVDLWKPPMSKHDIAFYGAIVTKAQHPTYWVTDEQKREIEVSVRRLRKIPPDPFAEEEKKDGDASADADADADSKADPDTSDVDDKYSDDDFDAPDAVMLESLVPEDTILYRDAGKVYAGVVSRVFNDAVEFQELVCIKKGKRLKLVRTWIDNDGVIVQSNYRPSQAESITYKIDKYAVLEKIETENGSLIPEALVFKYDFVVT